MSGKRKAGLLVYTMSQAIRNRFSINTMVEAAKRNSIELIPVRSDNMVDMSRLKNIDDFADMRYASSLPVISFGVDGLRQPTCYVSLSDRRTFGCNDLSFAILRGPFHMLHEHLSFMGVPTFNSAGFASVANSKIATLRLASELSIPFMQAYATCDMSAFVDSIEYPLVVKPDDGHGGEGVKLIDNDLDMDTAIDGQIGNVRLMQRVADTNGHDMRIYVLNGKIIAAMMRTGDGFLSNYTKGGTADTVDVNSLDDDVVTAVDKIIGTFGDFFAGIDFLRDGDRWVLGEIEDAVGCRMLYDKTDLDPFKMFIDGISKRIH